jgi:hypothetical protein
MASTPNYPSSLELVGKQMLPADSTTVTTLVPADADNDRRIDVLSLQTNNTSNVVLALFLSDGTTDFKVGEVVIPLQAGDADAVPVANGLDPSYLPWMPQDAGNYYIPLPAGTAVKGSLGAALSTGKSLDCTFVLAKYEADA